MLVYEWWVLCFYFNSHARVNKICAKPCRRPKYRSVEVWMKEAKTGPPEFWLPYNALVWGCTTESLSPTLVAHTAVFVGFMNYEGINFFVLFQLTLGYFKNIKQRLNQIKLFESESDCFWSPDVTASLVDSSKCTIKKLFCILLISIFVFYFNCVLQQIFKHQMASCCRILYLKDATRMPNLKSKTNRSVGYY